MPADVKGGQQVLPADPGGLYDVGNDPRVAGGLVTPGEAASITAVARKLRGEIYEGKWPVGQKVPSRQQLAKDYTISPESAGVVLRMLSGEGLVSLQQGSGTFVLPRHRFTASVTVPRDGATGEAKGVAAAVRKAEAAEPAVSGAEAVPGWRIRVTMTVECADAGRAAVIALAVVRAAHGGRWTWDGWDLDGASVEAAPAGQPD
jgi:GntR family transcriptional regulator